MVANIIFFRSLGIHSFFTVSCTVKWTVKRVPVFVLPCILNSQMRRIGNNLINPQRLSEHLQCAIEKMFEVPLKNKEEFIEKTGNCFQDNRIGENSIKQTIVKGLFPSIFHAKVDHSLCFEKF